MDVRSKGNLGSYLQTKVIARASEMVERGDDCASAFSRLDDDGF